MIAKLPEHVLPNIYGSFSKHKALQSKPRHELIEIVPVMVTRVMIIIRILHTISDNENNTAIILMIIAIIIDP